METEKQAGKWWTPRLAGPMIAAAALRFTLLIVALVRSGPTALISCDTSSYLIPGRNLLLHGSYVNAAGLPELFRTPGYPLFLAFFSLSGMAVASLAQLILSLFTVVLVWRLARAVFGDDLIALIAAWIFAFEPLSITYSVYLYSDSLFLLFFLLSLDRLVVFLLGRSLWVLAAAGAWLTVATFVRPVTYYLPVALAVGLFFVLARVPGLRWKAPAVLLVSVLPWLAVWQIRNWVETGFAGFSSVTVSNPYFYSSTDVTARAEHRPLEAVVKEFDLRAAQPGWSQAQLLAFQHREAARVFHAYPGLYLRSQLEGSIRVVFTPGAADLLLVLGLPAPNDREAFRHAREEGVLRAASWFLAVYPFQAILMIVLSGMTLALYGFAVWGVARGRAHGACFWLLMGVSLYLFAASGGAVELARYRLPVMPVVCIFAAAGLRRTQPPASLPRQAFQPASPSTAS